MGHRTKALASESIEPVGHRKHWQVVSVGVGKPVAARSPWRLSQCILDPVALLGNPHICYLRNKSTPKSRHGHHLHIKDEKIKRGRGEVAPPEALYPWGPRGLWLEGHWDLI